jgi:hypothetical protein
MSASTPLAKPLAEPFAFALVTWPAVIALLGAPQWPLWARILLGVWLAAMQLAAYGRGFGFGNIMLFLSGVIALACLGHPSPWILLWLPVVMIGLHAAQQARLRRNDSG